MITCGICLGRLYQHYSSHNCLNKSYVCLDCDKKGLGYVVQTSKDKIFHIVIRIMYKNELCTISGWDNSRYKNSFITMNERKDIILPFISFDKFNINYFTEQKISTLLTFS